MLGATVVELPDELVDALEPMELLELTDVIVLGVLDAELEVVAEGVLDDEEELGVVEDELDGSGVLDEAEEMVVVAWPPCVPRMKMAPARTSITATAAIAVFLPFN